MQELDKESIYKQYELLFNKFQRWIFVMFYPYLLALLGTAIAFSYPQLNMVLGLGISAVIGGYFEVYPINGNYLWGQMINLGVVIIIFVLVILLLVRRVYSNVISLKTGSIPLYIGLGAYILDTLILIIFPLALDFLATGWQYFVNIGIHLFFIVLMILLNRSHDKIIRFRKESTNL